MQSTRKRTVFRIALTALIVGMNAAPWLYPANVAYQIAQSRHVLLARFTVGQFAAVLAVAIISTLVLVVVWTKPANSRKRFLKLLVMTMSVLLSAFALDLALRFILPAPYVPEGEIYHRRPNTVFRGVTRDVPETQYSYPVVRPGHEDVPYTLSTDARGFRNESALAGCEVLVLGDSFAEASEVSDEQAWPVLLAERTGKRVYDLGMAGTNPTGYLASLKQIGLDLEPKVVLLVLYEGNDFRAGKAKVRTSVSYRLRVYRKRSPLLNALKAAMSRSLGGIGARRAGAVDEDHPLWPVAWLPLAVPEGDRANYYALEWKRLAAHWVTAEKFRDSMGFAYTTKLLGEMNAVCRERGIRFVVLFAPDKPHVVLPPARERLSAVQVRAFLALKMGHLPAADECFDALMKRLDVCESAAAEFCRDAGIEFVSLTRPLREELAAGGQVYFTYDQHWTPLGNRIVADVVTDLLVGRAAKQ